MHMHVQIYMCVHMHVQIHVCVYTCILRFTFVYIHVCAYGRQTTYNLGCCSLGGDHLYFKQHLTLAWNLTRTASEPQGSSYLPVSSTGIPGGHHHAQCNAHRHARLFNAWVLEKSLKSACLPSSLQPPRTLFAQSPQQPCAVHQGSQLVSINGVF